MIESEEYENFMKEAEEAKNMSIDDPDYEEKQREVVRDYIDAFVPKNHTTIIIPEKYKKAENVIAYVKKMVSDSIKDGFGDDLDAEYSVEWGGFLKENLVFKISFRDLWLSIGSLEIFKLIPLLPDDFQLVVFPKTDGTTEISIEFHNVKEVVSRDAVPADEWFSEE